MSRLVRKLRGAAGTALVWAVGWAVSGFVLISATMLVANQGTLYWDTLMAVTGLAGLSGLIGGGMFSLVLGAFAWRRLSDLKPLRMAMWGAAAGLVLPMGLVAFGLATGRVMELEVVGLLMALVAGLGAVTAGGTVKLAQRADRQLGPGG